MTPREAIALLTKPKSRKRPEQTLHLQVADYLRVALRPPVWWSSIDHGAGKMTPASAGLRRARGVKSGIPDIIILWPNNKAGIELKALHGSLSPAQRQTIKEWNAAGAYVAVCKSLDEVVAALTNLGIPLHAQPQ